MKKKFIKTAAAVLSMVLLLSGCQIGNKQIVVSNTLNNREVFKIGNTACGLKEAKVYLTNYQNIYGTAYDVNLWEHDFGDDSLVEYVKDITMEELVQVVCMDLLAESLGVALTDEELAGAADAAKEYYASLTDEELTYMGVVESDITQYYTHYALAQKLYNSLTSSVNDEVSDDEARIIEIMQIFVSDKAKAGEVLEKLNNGEDFATVASNYNELSVIQTTVSRDELPVEVEEIAFKLDDGEISSMITVDNGYYFVKCRNKYDEELTEANKSNIVEKREKEAFDDVYNEFVSGLSSNINQEVWDALEPDTGAGMVTDSFFEIFEKHCDVK